MSGTGAEQDRRIAVAGKRMVVRGGFLQKDVD
jgi:hypothetical protein